MSKKESKDPVFYFRAIPLLLSLITWPVIFVISFLIFGAFFISGNWIVKIFMVLLPLLFIYLILKNSIVYVKFFTDKICVKRPIGGEKMYSFDQISHFVFNREGFIPLDVIVAKRMPDKKKAFHFWCPKSDLKELETILEQNNKKIFPQK